MAAKDGEHVKEKTVRNDRFHREVGKMKMEKDMICFDS